MDRKEKIMTRVKKCYEMIQAGKPVRYAYKDAEIDGKTYKKYINEYLGHPLDTPLTDKDNQQIPTNKPYHRNGKNELKPLKSLVTITDPAIIEKILQESADDSTPVAIIMRKHISRSIRDKYKF